MPVLVKLRSLKVTSLDVDFHEVSWEVENFPSGQVDMLDYTFQVLRSESQEGPYDAITPAFEDRFNFVDNNVLVLHRWRQFHYKIRVTEKSSGDFEDFGPISITPQPDLVAIELRRHMRLLFQEFAGRRCIVLPVRTFGQRCECWNSTLQATTRSGCQACYDTGFLRGYMHPVEAFIQVDPSAKSAQNLNVGKTHQDNTTLRMGFYPDIKPDDLIIEPENKRWRVVQQNQTEHSRSPVHQEIQVHRIPEKDIEYKIPVKFGEELKNLFFTPARNFTNPQNLQGFEDEEVPNIFALYPSSYPTDP